jgi:hypothetical protein
MVLGAIVGDDERGPGESRDRVWVRLKRKCRCGGGEGKSGETDADWVRSGFPSASPAPPV